MQRIESKQFKKFFSSNKLLINCGILAILFLINCITPNFSYACYTALIIMIILSNVEDGFSLCVASIPFCCLNGYISVVSLFICFIVFLFKHYILAIYKHKKDLDKILLGFMLVVFLYMFCNARTYDFMLLVKILIIFTVIFVIYLFILYPNAPRLKFNLCLLALMLFVSVVYCLVYYPMVADTHYFFYVDEVFIRFEALLINPNTLAMICEICISLLAYYLLSGEVDALSVISFVLFSILGFCTFSKTFLILFVVVCFVLFIRALISHPIKSILWLIGFSLFVLLIYIFAGKFILIYFRRFIYADISNLSNDEILSMVTTTRSDLWMTYIRYLFMHPMVMIFGKGLNAKPITESAHNVYISLIYELGIIGTIFLVILIAMLVRLLFKSRPQKISLAILLPVSILALLMCVEDLVFFLY